MLPFDTERLEAAAGDRLQVTCTPSSANRMFASMWRFAIGFVVLAGGACRFESPPESRARTPHAGPRFVDRTTSVGLDAADWPAPEGDCEVPYFMARGAAIADIDRDGDDDLFLPHPSGPDRLYENHGGYFVRTDFDGEGGAGALFFDADDDGDLDLFVGAIAKKPPRFYRQTDDGRFVPEDVGLRFVPDPTGCYAVFGASAADADGDGDLDLFTAAWADADGTRLFENDGTGKFADVSRTRGLALEDTAGLVPFPSDLDEDGDVDLIVAADFTHTRVFETRANTFVDVSRTSTIPRIHDAMGVAAGDIDEDGDIDIFFSGICHRVGDFCNDAFYWSGNRLFSRAGKDYEDSTEAAGVKDAGWAWGAAFFDADLDGDLDLGVTNGYDFVGLFDDDPLRLFENDGKGVFVDVAAREGITILGQTRSIVPFDLEGDGDIDLLVTFADEPPRIFENNTNHPGNAFTVRLEQPNRNRYAIGARVRVRLHDGRWLRRDVHANSNYLSTSPPRAHFGLGGSRVEAVEVTWPDGSEHLDRRGTDHFGANLTIRR